MPEVSDTLCARPVVRHVAPILSDESMLQRLLLPPTVERRSMVEKSGKRAMCPVTKPRPQVNVRGEGRVVVPQAVVPQPPGFNRNIFLRARLQQGDVPADDGVGSVKNQSWIDRVRKRPLSC